MVSNSWMKPVPLPIPVVSKQPLNQSIHSWPLPSTAFAQMWAPDAGAIENSGSGESRWQGWALESGSVTYLEMTLAMPCSQSLVL